MTDKIIQGMVVAINYSLKDENGNLFEHRDIPVSYLHGSGAELFPKIEQALAGKSVGDQVNISLNPDESFGQHDPSLVFTDALFNVPEEFRRIGAEIEAESKKGESRLFYVTKIEDGTLTADGNHPLAGQTVNFIVTVVSIRQANDEEMRRGVPDQDPSMQLFQ